LFFLPKKEVERPAASDREINRLQVKNERVRYRVSQQRLCAVQ